MRFKISLFILLICYIFTMPMNAVQVQYGDFGDVYYMTSETVAPGIDYKVMHADNQRGFVFEYTPQMGTIPKIVYGDSVYGRNTLGSMIETYNDTGDGTIAAGINADFFSMVTGVPLGVMINDGKLYASCEGKNAFGLYPNGLAVIGKPETDITLNINESDIEEKVEYFNKYPSVYNIYILNSDYGETTTSKIPSLEIVVKTENDAVFTQWCDIRGVVTDIYRDSHDNVIEEGHFIISIANDSKFYEDFKNVRIGEEVTLTIRCDEKWRDVVTAVGGGDIILNNSLMPDGIVDEDHEELENPRTAVGITSHGKVIFFAVDGRRNGHSKGLTLDQLASAMRSLGCITALNLDGGGSTTVIIRNNLTGEYKLMNRPTDGTQRKISSAVVFVNMMQSDGEPEHISITPNQPQVLSKGGKVKLDINIFDAAFNLLDVPFIYEYELNSENDIGYIDMENDIFTATAESGSAVLTAKVNINGKILKTQTEITITPTLTDFVVTPQEDNVKFGGSLQLDFKGYRLTYEVFVVPERFKIESESGYVDKYGVFHHDGVSKLDPEDETVTDSISISISYGNKTQFVNLNLTDINPPYSDIENHWAEGYINRSFINGWLISDFADSDNNYRPSKNLTRAEFASILALFNNFDTTNGYINAVLESGLMRGKLMSDGSVDFAGNDTITRTEIMYVLSQILADYGIEPTELSFNDIEKVPDWASDNINLAVSAGLVKGYEDNTLRPLNNVTRAEIAAIFIRLKEITQ